VRVVGIIPAAGYGTRLQPRPGSKEVFPIGGRPVMDYEVERMRAAPCDELRVVTRPEKRDVIENARRHGAVVIEAHPPSLGQSLYAGLRGLDDDDVVLIGFPDSLWEPVEGYRLLLEFRDRGGWDVALGLLPAPDMRREEPVIFDRGSGRVSELEFKPAHPSADMTWVCAAAPAALLMEGLADEDEPGKLFNRLCGGGQVGALPLPGSAFVDMGTATGLKIARAIAGGAGSAR
jgi:glucose-1-phosphate thymidylyltransferase